MAPCRGPGGDRASVADDQSPDVQAALENARAIAAALAAGDWAEARRLGPTDRSRTDAQLEAGYGAGDRRDPPAGAGDPAHGGRTDLRLGLVAHEDHASGPATAVMCVHWRVDDAQPRRAAHLVGAAAPRARHSSTRPTVADELRATCATYPLAVGGVSPGAAVTTTFDR